jgi:hypothetical protein
MSNRRARMLRLDARTGRLERAIHLLEDGHKAGVMTRDPDRPHPQSRPVGPVIDRAMIRIPKPEVERGTFTYNVGLEGNSNLERVQTPVLVFGLTWGTYEFSDVITGYSVYGYGQHGYSGFSEPDLSRNWSG